MAAVTADTWATELGELSRKKPRLITKFKEVERGTSGAVSVLGIGVSLIGAYFIALVWNLLSMHDLNTFNLLIITLSGFAGSLVDSFLGASIQAKYSDEEEKKIYEEAGEHRILVRGWKWVDNDIVNLACACAGGLLAFLLGF